MLLLKWRLNSNNDRNVEHQSLQDPVNHPPHYNRGPVEVIEIIESAIQDAPDMPTAYCHGNAIKYLLRLWLKGDPLENAKKCRWYLDRLIAKLGA